MGFTADTPTVAGVVLIRSSIQSPNYVAGVSGWTINQDGSAEFNNATFRGTVLVDGSNNAYITIDNPGGNPQIQLRPDDIPGYAAYNASIDPALILAVSFDGGTQNSSLAFLRLTAPGVDSSISPSLSLLTASFDNVTTVPMIDLDTGSPTGIVTIEGSLSVDRNLTIGQNVTIAGSLTAQGIQPGRPPVVRLAQKAAQSIPNATATAITYGASSEELKLNGSTTWHNVAVNNTRITPTISGIYEVRVTTSMDTAAGGNYTQVAAAVGKNGTRISPQAIARPDAGTPANTTTTSAICLLNGSTDYVEHYATQNNSGAANQLTAVATGSESVMELVLIGI